jgi:hypothetical protein
MVCIAFKRSVYRSLGDRQVLRHGRHSFSGTPGFVLCKQFKGALIPYIGGPGMRGLPRAVWQRALETTGSDIAPVYYALPVGFIINPGFR